MQQAKGLSHICPSDPAGEEPRCAEGTLGSWAVSRTPTPWRKVLRFKCRCKPVLTSASSFWGSWDLGVPQAVWEGLLCSDKLLSATSPCKPPNSAPPRRAPGSLCFWRMQSPFVSSASKTMVGLPASAGGFWVAWAWHKGFWGRRRVPGCGDKHLVHTVSATVATDTWSKYTGLYLESLPAQGKCSSLRSESWLSHPGELPSTSFSTPHLQVPGAGLWGVTTAGVPVNGIMGTKNCYFPSAWKWNL